MKTNQFSLKYRPIIFDEIFGHEKIILDLKNRSKNNDFPKVSLFTGITGTGKTTLFKILTKVILCENKEEGNPCNKCISCKAIDEEKPLENVTMLNASNLGIEEMRDLALTSSRKIFGGKKKIIIIDELQEIASKKAQKNILTLLEKQNNNTYFILGAMDSSKLDRAIINRSVRYHLLLSIVDIRNCLVSIITKEKIKPTTEIANMITTIAENCENSLRTAISMLERVIYSNIETEQELLNELGIISNTKLNELVNAMLLGDNIALDLDINENVLEQIKEKLLYIYKSNNKIKLLPYQKANISSIFKVADNIVVNTIEILNELNNFKYLNKTIIEFQLLKIILSNKPQVKRQAVR